MEDRLGKHSFFTFTSFCIERKKREIYRVWPLLTLLKLRRSCYLKVTPACLGSLVAEEMTTDQWNSTITRSGPKRPAAAVGGMIFWDLDSLVLWLVVLVFLAIETR